MSMSFNAPEKNDRQGRRGYYDQEKPGMGRATQFQLFLTDKRLVFMRYYMGKSGRLKIEDYSGRIEEGLKVEGSSRSRWIR